MTIESQLVELTSQTQALDNTIQNELVDVNEDISALRARVTALEIGAGPGGGGGGGGEPGGGGDPGEEDPDPDTGPPTIPIVDALPPTGELGEVIFFNGKLYFWNGTGWQEAVSTADAPPAVEVVEGLPAEAEEGTVVYDTVTSKMYQRINGVWVEMVVTVNTQEEVADASVTVAKFALGLRPVEVLDALPSTGNVQGRLVFLTTDNKLYRYNGTAFVNKIGTEDLTGEIGADQIAANSITTGKIQAGAVTASQIAANAINAAKIAAGSITSDKIVANAVTADKIATNAVTADKIVANAITAGKIAAAAIGTSQLAAGAITTDKLQAGIIGANQLAANAVTAGKIAAGAVNVASLTSSSGAFNGVTFGLGSGLAINGMTAGGWFQANATTKAGVIGRNDTGGMAGAFGNIPGPTGHNPPYAALIAVSSTSSSYVAPWNSNAEIAHRDWAGFFAKGSKWIYLASGTYAFQTSGGANGTFTGAHDGLLAKTAAAPAVGDILVDVRPVAKPNVYDTITEVAVSSAVNQKSALGVFAEFAAESHVPTALGTVKTTNVTRTITDDKGLNPREVTESRNEVIVDPAYTAMLADFRKVVVNGVGEGQINVCGLGGSIEVGDLIVTSAIPGKGMKQADDIVRSYTVAKAREAVTFSHPHEVKMIACIYMAG